MAGLSLSQFMRNHGDKVRTGIFAPPPVLNRVNQELLLIVFTELFYSESSVYSCRAVQCCMTTHDPAVVLVHR